MIHIFDEQDDIAQAENAPLRDFCGLCLSEYYVWSYKHGSNEKIRDILKYIVAMSSHAAERYRQGRQGCHFIC